ncbi:PA14 domain-containing protein [Oscillatoria laete-virens NRMC-F 0139]|nr:PA14 domain-containing protein [Oscillatoria laete-virens]MDL5052160.1 PA14 domain-containing protein [Oscillatoria laete-virens NRMC-F 0139]
MAAPSLAKPARGLLARYYDNSDLTNLALTRVDSAVNFTWGTGSPDGAIQQDTFSVQWCGKIEARYSETYTFYTTSDDGVRLWINGKPIISNWSNHSATEDSGQVALVAGQLYDVVLEMYENTGDAVAKFSWSSPSQAKEIVPQSVLYPQDTTPMVGNGDGLKGVYFPTMDFRGTSVSRVDTTVNFDWVNSAPVGGIPADNFSAVWSGQVQAQFSEPYTFTVRSDDGARLYVNGSLILDTFADRSAADTSSRIVLSAGEKYNIRLEYYENKGQAVAQLSWASAQTTKRSSRRASFTRPKVGQV